MKKLIVIFLAALTAAMCGCSQRNNTTSESSDGDIIVVSDTSVKPLGDDRIKREHSPEVSAPSGSVSIEQACRLLDSCSMEQFYLSESMSKYKKYYFNTVDFNGEKYYSFYPYLEINGKKIYVGTNVIADCTGNFVLAKNWMGGYETVNTSTAINDRDYTERYPDAKISPNEALAVLTEKEKLLGLDSDISEYIFETDETLSEINGVPCYRITPKVEYLDHIELLSPYYVLADKSSSVMVGVKGKQGEYKELK